MSKITALITMLALGAASPALASTRTFDRRGRIEPSRIERDRDRVAPRDTFDRGWRGRGALDDFGPRRYRPTWVALGESRLARTGALSIEVHDRNTFTQLRLQTAGGIARVDRVIIRFADGTTQLADPHRLLDTRDELLEIPLDGNNRRVECITVIGDTDRRTALQVFGI